MHYLASVARRGVATTFLAVAAVLPVETIATSPTATQQNERNEIPNLPGGPPGQGDAPAKVRQGSMLTVPAFAPLFATTDDARAFWNMSSAVYAAPIPDARTVARAFIREHFGIDGDAYVVAHFASAEMRAEGGADNVSTLTDALMMAFPGHASHTFFARIADTVGGLTAGGKASPGALTFAERMIACREAAECFSTLGGFLWSRTGPGYVYNTFVAGGNVIETVGEDLRPLDEAFGIFPVTSRFLPENASPLRLSDIVAKCRERDVFAELPYIKLLKASLDRYWYKNQYDWPVLARYRFVQQARGAHATGVLTQAQYEAVMQAAAPFIPLEGAITLRQLRDIAPAITVRIKRFDINGYTATDILRFVFADGSEVMYIPGAKQPFATFRNEGELRQWVVARARHPAGLEELLSHFSIYHRQDGVFWTGVAQGLAHLGTAQWTPDSATIDRNDALILGDVFEDMRAQVEARLRDDARMQTSSAWDAWRATINRTATVLGPVGYAPPVAIPVQAGSALVGLGTGIDQGINGKTTEERKQALEQAVMTVVTSAATAIGMSRVGSSEEASAEPGPSLYSVSQVSQSPGTSVSSPPRRVGFVERMPTEDPRTPISIRSLDQDRLGYLVQALPRDSAERVQRVIGMKKAEIDERRHRLDDFRKSSFKKNRYGYYVSLDHSLAYRVDDRTPRQLLAHNGFGPSRRFNDIVPMLLQRSTIGSGSLRANNLVFEEWQDTASKRQTYHQYAIWTEGRPVASASDNHDWRSYDSILDEVHFPADIPAKDIYIIDSSNPTFARALADLYESRYISSPYGIPLAAFVEYLYGGLDIHAPNLYTAMRLRGSFRTQVSSSSQSRSAVELGFQPLSSSDTRPSGEDIPLIPMPSRSDPGMEPPQPLEPLRKP